ncbi:hypothetical protein GC167_08650 [bacterium]|nr:hypothetical protein [bacterium]
MTASTTAFPAGNYRFNANNNTAESAIGHRLRSGASNPRTGNAYKHFVNAGAAITSLDIAYDIEKYKQGMHAPGFSMVLYYSTDGVNWTAAGAPFNTVIPADASNNGYPVAPGTTTSVSGTFVLPASISNGQEFFLCWSWSGATGTSFGNIQAAGIDNVSISVSGACTTAVDPTGFAAVSADSQADLSWVNDACADEVLIVTGTSSISFAPTGDGTAYTANAAYGSGTDLGGGNYVVYKGLGSSVSVTALTNLTPYFFKVYTRVGTSWSAGVEVSTTPIGGGGSSNDLMITEVVEGSGSNQYVEFYNGTNAPIALANYEFVRYSNGALTPTNVMPSTNWVVDTLFPGQTYVIRRSGASLAGAPFDQNGNANSTMTFDGNDVIALRDAATDVNIDVVGVIGSSANFNQNVTLRRKSDVCAPTTTYDAAEWDVFALNSEDLKNHVQVCTGAFVYNNGWIPSDPSGVASSTDTVLVQAGNAVISSSTTLGYVEIAMGTSLTVAPNADLTLTNLSNNGSLVLSADASGYAQYIGPATTATVQKYYDLGAGPGNGRWLLMGSPVSTTYGTYLAPWNIVKYATAMPASDRNVFTYNGVDYVSVPGAGSTLTPGQGFTVYAGTNASAAFTPDAFTVEVTGSTLNSTIPVVTVYGLGTSSFGYIGDANGWNLVSNPFTSGVNNASLLNLNSTLLGNFEGTLYGWDGTSYQSENSVGVGSFNVAAPFQAMWVKHRPAPVFSPNVFQFVSSAREFTDGTFFKAAQNEFPLITVSTNWANGYDEKAYIGFHHSATSGYDSDLDAYKLSGSTPGFAHLMTYLPNNDGMSIQMFEDRFDSKSIELGFDSQTEGQYTLNFDLKSIPASWNVILHDLVTGAEHDLRSGAYVFNHANGNVIKRFVVVISTEAFGTEEIAVGGGRVDHYVHGRTLFIEALEMTANSTLSIVDMSGKKVMSVDLAAGTHRSELSLEQLGAGVYLVLIEGSNVLNGTKLILE